MEGANIALSLVRMINHSDSRGKYVEACSRVLSAEACSVDCVSQCTHLAKLKRDTQFLTVLTVDTPLSVNTSVRQQFSTLTARIRKKNAVSVGLKSLP